MSNAAAAFAGPVCAIALVACQPASPTGSAPPPIEARPLAFAQGACGGCHAVEADTYSPQPLAPEWAAIVNRPGVTEDTLKSWLTDAHNYPEEMDFDLDPPQVEALVRYMMTLRRADYRPPG